jgi:hypothetical protein
MTFDEIMAYKKQERTKIVESKMVGIKDNSERLGIGKKVFGMLRGVKRRCCLPASFSIGERGGNQQNADGKKGHYYDGPVRVFFRTFCVSISEKAPDQEYPCAHEPDQYRDFEIVRSAHADLPVEP